MNRTSQIILLFIFLLISSGAYSLEIEKVTPSLQYLYNYYYDPGALKVKCDSSKIDEDKDTMRSGKIYDSLPLEEVEPVYKPNDAALFFIDSIPYIWTVLRYNGDESDLQPLGVLVGAYHGGVIGVRFPLSILPQVAALSTVIAIRDNATVELEDDTNFGIPFLDSIRPKMKDTIEN